MEDAQIQKVVCPNCGKRLVGIMDKSGGTRLSCERCSVHIYSRQITPRKIRLDVTMPVYNQYNNLIIKC